MSIFGQLSDKLNKTNTTEFELIEGNQLDEQDEVELDIDPHIPITILNEDNDESFSFRLIVMGLNEITLERLPGVMQLPLYKHGEIVRFMGYDNDMNVVMCRGSIKKSSYINCVITDIEIEKHTEHREHSRQMLNVKAKINVKDKEDSCVIKDISIGGARLASREMYNREETFRLTFKLAENQPELELQGKFMRFSRRTDGELEYGVMFAQLNERQSHTIANGILEAQKELRDKVGLE